MRLPPGFSIESVQEDAMNPCTGQWSFLRRSLALLMQIGMA